VTTVVAPTPPPPAPVLAEALPQIVWTATADGVLDYVNGRGLAYTGLPADRLLGRGWEAVVHPDDRARSLAHWAAAVGGRTPLEVEYRLRRADGAWRWHLARAVPTVEEVGQDGGRVRWIGTCTDVEDQRRAAALRRSEEHLRLVVESLGDYAVTLLDVSGRVTWWNGGAGRMAGYADEEILGVHFGILFPAEDVAEGRASDLLRRARRDGRAEDEGWSVRRDGSRFWADAVVTALLDSDGAHVGFAKITRDLTHRRTAVRALQESEARFQAFMDHIPLTAWLKDGAGRYVYVNRTWEASFGRALDAVVGRTDDDLFPPAVARQLREHDARVLASGQALETMEAVPTPDGIARTWLAVKFPMEDPTGGRCIGGTGLDVTERVRQEEAVRRADARYRAASDSSLDAFIMLAAVRDPEGRIDDFVFTDLNARAAVLIGRERLDLVGRRVGDIIPRERAPALFEAYARVTEGSGPLEEEFTLALPRFEGRWFHHQVVALGDGAAVTVREITVRRRADAAMRQAKEAAEAANRAKSDFLARMSHELRTPLNSVIGFSEVLRTRADRSADPAGATDPQARLLLERIGANGRHLLGLINDILDLSKVEAGRLQLELVPVRVDALLAEVAGELEPLAAHRGVSLTLRPTARTAAIAADETRLRQVLLNLVGNAVKFTERGEVRLSLETDPETGRPRRIEIADTGIGIPPERQAAIFQAFEQAEIGTTRAFGGTGLGLTISRALCEAMGYRLELTRSTEGEGSVFGVHLP
jgi:PAS domain S-box-containing protein